MHILRRSLNLVRNGRITIAKGEIGLQMNVSVKMLRAKESNHKENNGKQIKELYEWHLKIRRQENSEKRCRLKNRPCTHLKNRRIYMYAIYTWTIRY